MRHQLMPARNFKCNVRYTNGDLRYGQDVRLGTQKIGAQVSEGSFNVDLKGALGDGIAVLQATENQSQYIDGLGMVLAQL